MWPKRADICSQIHTQTTTTVLTTYHPSILLALSKKKTEKKLSVVYFFKREHRIALLHISFFHSMPNFFPVFCVFFIPLEKNLWIFLPCSDRKGILGKYFPPKAEFQKLKNNFQRLLRLQRPIQNNQKLKELGKEQQKIPSNISDRSVSSGETWKHFSLIWKKNLRGFFISDVGKGHFFSNRINLPFKLK